MDKSTRVTSVADGDILFAFSSIYWLSGIANLVKSTFYGTIQIITTKSYSPDYLLELIEKYKITHIFASLQQINAALHQVADKPIDLSSVKSVALSGQKVPQNDYTTIRKHFENAVPYNMFGLSELGGAISISRGFQVSLNGCGKLVNGLQVKIVDENGNRLGIGERGRIFVKSDYYFNGYFGKEDMESIIDQENFLKTCNVGYFDPMGYLHVLGREIDMIKYQNYQISPKEIENVLHQHDAIQLACVVAVATLEEDLVAALIVRTTNAAITEDDVHNLISGKKKNRKRTR